MKVRLTFTEAILGTWPSNENIAREYIASKSPDAEILEQEIEALDADVVAEKGKTVFPRFNGVPIFYDYQIKGFFKDSCSMLARYKTTDSAKLKAFRKIIDGLIFIEPRHIPICFDGEIGECQRPLRASTPQGERVALAFSEEIPEGATAEFEVVEDLGKEYIKYVCEWLDYGRWRGLGQWRNSGKGRFLWEELDDDGNVIGGNKDIVAIAK